MNSHPESRNKNCRNGFTLTEILLVMVLFVSTFSLLIPIGFRLYRNTLVDDTSRTLVETLRRARTYAQTGRGDAAYGVKIVSASSSLVLFQGNSYAARNASEDEVIEYPSTVTISASSTETVFSRLYGTSTVDGAWTVSFGALTSVVSINRQGTIELE